MSSDGSGYAQAAGSVAVAVIQADVARSTANKQFDIAKLQIGLAKFVQDTWKTNHLPCELKLLAEVCSKPAYVPAYDMVTARASNDVAIAFGKSRQDMRRNASTYCIGSIVANERQITVAQALIEADSIASARRREDGRADLKEQQSIDNRFKVAAIGRGLLDQSGSGFKAAAAGFASGGSTIASALNSGAQLLGYLSTRNFGAGKRGVNDGGSPDSDAVFDEIRRSGMGYFTDPQVMQINAQMPTGVTGRALESPGTNKTISAPTPSSDVEANIGSSFNPDY